MVFREPGGASVNKATFSPYGTLIVTASGDGTARIWNAVSGQQQQVLGGLEDPVLNGAAFSPNGREVVTASAGGTATTWNAASGKSILVLSGHRGPVSAASFSPSGSVVVTASDDGTAKIRDAQPVGTRRVLADPTRAPLGCGGFNRSGTEVVAAVAKGSGVADIWNTVTAAFSPNGSEVLTSSGDGTARIWSSATGKQLTVFETGSGVND
jgi:WD40 repeat protein